jgi:putative Ca2+/H+ antiporter (TMEM165/GDT1 family)
LQDAIGCERLDEGASEALLAFRVRPALRPSGGTLPAFIAAALGEWGDKTQLLLIALAARYGRPGQLARRRALAALAGSLLASFGGTLINGTVTLRRSRCCRGGAVFAGRRAFIARKTLIMPNVAKAPQSS